MKTIDLAGQWKLTGKTNNVSVNAQVPGDTHSALLAAGKIPDPYFLDNETRLLHWGAEDWTYERNFDVPLELLQENSIFLHCDSLDTLATIFINNRKIAVTENMFIRSRIEVKKKSLRGDQPYSARNRLGGKRPPLRPARNWIIPCPTTKCPCNPSTAISSARTSATRAGIGAPA